MHASPPTLPPAQSSSRPPRTRSLRRWALLAGAVLAVAAVGFAVVHKGLQRQPRQSGNNGVFPSEGVISIGPGKRLCQSVRVPVHTGALEIALEGKAPTGGLKADLVTPEGRVVASSVAEGRRVGRVRFTLDRVLTSDMTGAVCMRDVSPSDGYTFRGSLAQAGLALQNKPAKGALTVVYMRPGAESNFAMIGVVMSRIGVVREWLTGTLRSVVIIVLTLAGIAITALLLLGRSRRRAGLAVAAVAVLNAIAWSL